MNRSIFHLVEEDRHVSKGDNRYFACRTKDGDKVAFWGSNANTRNIDLVEAAGFPCTVNCQWRPPKAWAQDKFGHTHWVPENAELEIVPAIQNK